jgi:hypothetical protein
MKEEALDLSTSDADQQAVQRKQRACPAHQEEALKQE